MCGIVACISRKAKPVDKDRLIRAGKRMSHRGPDDRGVFMSGWIGMAHNRLSIIDLSKEAGQPMFSRDGRYVIVYNGEVYNYRVMREELMKDGFRFSSRSDTEVVLNSYMKYSTGCLDRLRGMFAFVIADLHKREVFAARDPFGIKPLYINTTEDRIVFSSEIKPMSEFVPLEPDYDNYLEKIMFRDLSGDRTSYKNITSLLPGHYFTYQKDKDEPARRNYYRLDKTFSNGADLKGRTEDDIIDEAEEILAESIKMHTYSDVGYNLQLSGGIDSSLIAVILAKRLNCTGLDSYSVVLEDAECDESSYQNIVTDTLGLRNHRIEVSNKVYTENLEKSIYFIEKPVVHPGSVCLFHLTKESVLNSKVILTGEGADEAFGGYNRYNIPLRLKFMTSMRDLGLHKAIYPLREISDTANRIYKKVERDQLLEYTSLYSWHESEKLVNSRFISGLNLGERGSLLKSALRSDLRSVLLYYDQNTYLATLLDRQDKLSMANSVEARVPYIDRRLYEFANSLPSSLKFKKGQLKYVLRKIAEKYLPTELIYRKKNGLNLPLKEWFKDKRFLGRYLDMLLDSDTRKRGIYNADYLEYMVKSQKAGSRDFTVKLAMLVNFELWHRIFFDKTVEVPSCV